MTYKTRSERHQKIQRKYTLNRKTVLPLLGTGLVLAPTNGNGSSASGSTRIFY